MTADECNASGSWLDDFFPLHKAVFHNDIASLAQLLRDQENDIDKRDTHGNTALHIACMFGHEEVAKLLLSHGANLSLKNNTGWKSLHEAISFGNRQIIELLLVAFKKQSHSNLMTFLPELQGRLSALNDFYMESKWQFSSWIPLLSRILPSDTFKIYKRGVKLRVDFTLIDFNDKAAMPSWTRGDVSLLFDPTAPRERQTVLMDNQLGVYQAVKDKNKHIADELDLLMSSDIVSSHMSTRTINFVRAKNWLMNGKSDWVGDYNADFYNVKGMTLITRKRREHLSREDLKRNKELKQIFSTGKLPSGNAESGQMMCACANREQYRRSLTPPPRPDLTWSQYLRVPDALSHLGRGMNAKVDTKEIGGLLVGMSPNFPLALDSVLNIFDVLAPVNPALTKLRTFCNCNMPPGFPVSIGREHGIPAQGFTIFRLEVPIFAAVHAKISFPHFQWQKCESFSEKLFQIPKHYTCDPRRFQNM